MARRSTSVRKNRKSVSSLFFEETAPVMALKSLFEKYDTDKNGKLDSKEMTVLLKQDLGLNSDQADVYIYLLDKDGDKHISFEEFYEWITSQEDFQCITDKTRFYYIQKAIEMFRRYDWDESHALDEEEFQGLFRDMGGRNENIEKTFSDIDTDGNGNISFPEFLRWLKWVDLDELF